MNDLKYPYGNTSTKILDAEEDRHVQVILESKNSITINRSAEKSTDLDANPTPVNARKHLLT
jgi:hypothetical protein